MADTHRQWMGGRRILGLHQVPTTLASFPSFFGPNNVARAEPTHGRGGEVLGVLSGAPDRRKKKRAKTFSSKKITMGIIPVGASVS